MIETLVGTALGTREHDLQEVAQAVAATLGARGWAAPPAEFDPEGEYLRVLVLDQGKAGRWVLVEDQGVSQLPLARELAQKLGSSLEVRELVAREEVVRRADDEIGFTCRARALRIQPDGRMQALGSPLGEEELSTAHGDLHETAGHLLRAMLDLPEGRPGTSETVERYLPSAERRPDALSPRMNDLCLQVALAGGYQLDELGGRRMLRLELPDGARRMTAISDEELQILERVTGFAPPAGALKAVFAGLPRVGPPAPAPVAAAPAPAPKKPTPKKPTPKKPAPKKPASKKPAAGRAASNKPVPRKPAPKKPAGKPKAKSKKR